MTRQAGIIGAGNIGSAVAQRLVHAGYEVRMANSRGPASLREHAAALGAIGATLQEAARARDFVLIAIPEFAVAHLPKDLFAQTAADCVVLDAGNYYPGLRDGHIPEIDAGMPDSQWVAQTIGRPVAKMFNTIHAGKIAEGHRPRGANDRIALPVAADDAQVRARAIAMADEIGFDGLDAGDLSQSWRQQPGTPIYCTHLPFQPACEALLAARRDDVAVKRQEALDRARTWRRDGADVGTWKPSA
jgi:Predicted dinucleotide-binding enzymes